MTLDEARSVLTGDAGMSDLLEAIGTIAQDPNGSPEDLMLGLPHPELIAEQAALALYARTGRPLPKDRSKIATDPKDWTVWLLQLVAHGPKREKLRALDPPKWQLDLCRRNLESRLRDPMWSELLTTLLLHVPDHPRSSVPVRQSSFGQYEALAPDDVNAQTANKTGSKYRVIHSSAAQETTQFLALELVISRGYAIAHQDVFPGFETSVCTRGEGILVIGSDEGTGPINVYALKCGSCVGVGARRPHAVLATGTHGLAFHQICFPHRRADSVGRSKESNDPLYFCFLWEPIDASVVLPELMGPIETIAQAIRANKRFRATPSRLQELFDDVSGVRVAKD